MSLTGRWVDLIYRVATGKWQTRLLVAPFVGTAYIGSIVVFILLSCFIDRRLGLPRASFYPVSHIIGWCAILCGLFLMILSIAYFLKARGTPVPFSPPPRLVIAGPYRFARNPMLTGIFMQLFGIAIVLGSFSLALIFTPLFIYLNVWELKNVEEPELTRRFGEAYTEYRKRVPMFFPFKRVRFRDE